MENHPIPQDITGFQFKLIGNMTVKQFAYLAAGAIIAWLIYASPLFFILKIILAFVSALLGVSFAFMPIEGRPLDVMVVNFIKAMFNPTQFLYEKTGGHLYTQASHAKAEHKKKEEQPKNEAPKINEYLNQMSAKKDQKEDQKEMVFFSNLATMYNNPTQAPNVTPKVALSHSFDSVASPQEPVAEKPSNDSREKAAEQKAMELEKELALAKQKESTQTDPALVQQAHLESIALEEELRKTIGERDRLEQQLIELHQKLNQQKQNVFTPSVAQAPQQTKNVRVVPQGVGKSIGLPIAPDSPNIVSGIVKDPRENPLPNILVEVKDQDGNPVRAFKTNGVGQFASATALSNGVYTIEFEDPKEENRFDSIQFEANGNIILPIEVISVDKREELRRELFN